MTLAHERAAAFRDWINSDSVFIAAGKSQERPGDPLKYANMPRTDGAVGALVGHLNRVCGGDDARSLFLNYCFGVNSSKDLHIRQRNALLAWLAPRKFDAADAIPTDYEEPGPGNDWNPDGGWSTRSCWLVRQKCHETAGLVVRAAREALGQMVFGLAGETE